MVFLVLLKQITSALVSFLFLWFLFCTAGWNPHTGSLQGQWRASQHLYFPAFQPRDAVSHPKHTPVQILWYLGREGGRKPYPWRGHCPLVVLYDYFSFLGKVFQFGGKCKEQDALQARRKTEQKTHDVSKENHSFLPPADLDLPFKLRPPPTTLDNLLFLSGGELRRRWTRMAQERSEQVWTLCRRQPSLYGVRT